MNQDPVQGPVRFPPGRIVLSDRSWGPGASSEIDSLLSLGQCPEGRVEVSAGTARVVCLIHNSLPYVAGIVDGGGFTRIPLAEFPLRAGQLDDARCTVVQTEATLVLMEAAHFGREPAVKASTRYVDLAHLIHALGEEKADSAIALERNGRRLLAFLHAGEPARLFAHDDGGPGEGDILDRLLEHAFTGDGTPGTGRADAKIEVFKNLNIHPDPDAGVGFGGLTQLMRPAPLITLSVRMRGDERELFRKVFVPPHMIVGRNKNAHVFLDNLGVSREHARMSWDDGALFVEDLKSGNGTHLNEELVTRARVAPGDVVRIGKFEVVIEKASDFTAAPERTVLLNVHEDSHPVYLAGDDTFVEIGDILIGSGPGVDVRAEGWFVKPVHARIESRLGSFRIQGFGRAKVRVNGTKTRSAPLAPGDTIQVGRTRFELTSLESLRRS